MAGNDTKLVESMALLLDILLSSPSNPLQEFHATLSKRITPTDVLHAFCDLLGFDETAILDFCISDETSLYPLMQRYLDHLVHGDQRTERVTTLLLTVQQRYNDAVSRGLVTLS
jgi:hypothetical protein